jgi:hypothetical protein
MTRAVVKKATKARKVQRVGPRRENRNEKVLQAQDGDNGGDGRWNEARPEGHKDDDQEIEQDGRRRTGMETKRDKCQKGEDNDAQQTLRG